MSSKMWINFGPEPSVAFRLYAPDEDTPEGYFEVDTGLAQKLWDYACAMEEKVQDAREGRA